MHGQYDISHLYIYASLLATWLICALFVDRLFAVFRPDASRLRRRRCSLVSDPETYHTNIVLFIYTNKYNKRFEKKPKRIFVFYFTATRKQMAARISTTDLRLSSLVNFAPEPPLVSFKGVLVSYFSYLERCQFHKAAQVLEDALVIIIIIILKYFSGHDLLDYVLKDIFNWKSGIDFNSRKITLLNDLFLLY